MVWEQDVSDRLGSTSYVRAVEDQVDADVRPYSPDVWVDFDKTKIGYEIPVTRHFYRYVPPRPLAEIDTEIRDIESDVQVLLAKVTT